MMSRLALLMLSACAVQAADFVVAGDSWGTYGRQPLLDMLARKGSNMTVNNIAVSGATSNQWAPSGQYHERLLQAVSNPQVRTVWVTLGGNDAKDNLPLCGLTGGSAEKCIDNVVNTLVPNLEAILDAVKGVNPNARVVAFGYDILGLGKDNGICAALPIALLPKCKGDTTCFNTYFLRLQQAVEDLAARRSDVLDAVNLVGSIQAGAGFPGVTVTHPDLSQFSPGKFMLSNCIHPNDEGFVFVFDNLWDAYLKRI